jgi:hypothetical protein
MRDARFQGGRLLDSEEFVARPPLGCVLEARRQECLCHGKARQRCLVHTKARQECLCHKTRIAEVAYSVEWRIRGLFVFNKMRAISFVRVCRVESAENWHKMRGDFGGFRRPWGDSAAPQNPPIRYCNALHDAPPTSTLAQRATGARM